MRRRSRDRDVLYLEYEAFEEMAEPMLARLADELTAKHGLCKVAIHHRIGRVEIGEPSVVIAVSAPHRAAALDACREAIDTLKETIPLWKKEVYAGGEEWIGTRLLMDEFRDEKPIHPQRRPRRTLERLGAAASLIGGAALKFGFIFVKFFGFFISVAAYTLWFHSWTFALGFVLMILVHELGHIVEARASGAEGVVADVHPVLRRVRDDRARAG